MDTDEKKGHEAVNLAAIDLMNALPNGAIVINSRGNILQINFQAVSLLSINQEELVGRSLKDILPTGGEDVLSVVHSNRQAAGLTVPELENCFLHISPLSKTDHCFLIIIFDYRLWSPLLGSASTVDPLSPFLTKIFEASADGITITNKNGHMILVNKSAADSVGVSKNELQGRHVSYLLQKNLASDQLSLDVLRNKKSVSKVVTHIKTGRQVLSTATPIFNLDNEVEMVVLNERDITSITQLEGNLQEKKEVMEKFKEEINALSLVELKQKDMVAESPAMASVLGTAVRLAHHGVSHVLITGESGTGKSLLAKFIHKHSKRSEKPFVHINCAALPESLLEAELFGYEKGAFTGAASAGKAGLFEVASDGTVFLDEIGEMPIALQAKLLTFLDTSEFRRIGGTMSKKAECAIITATNQNLEILARNRHFRSDLFFRLRAFSLNIPPLRSRPEDIFLLAKTALDSFNKKYTQNKALDPLALEVLQGYHYPGNIRELINMIHQAVLLSDRRFLGSFLQATINLPANSAHPAPAEPQKENAAPPPLALDEPPLYESAKDAMERKVLIEALGKSRNTRDMAAYLGISQASVCRKLRKHGLAAPGTKQP